LTLPILQPFWDWTPQAVARFFQMAHVQGRRELRIREGMNAALAEDLALLAPAMTRFWIETLEESGALGGRILRIADGDHTFRLPITRALLVELCLLDTPLPVVSDVEPASEGN
jgi:hypothetical protein